jgi:iron(III) transport system ATP-binding protein
MSAIELRTVTKTYGERAAVDRISMSVERGERAVLFGPSGCGKTTVLRLIAGLEVPNFGAVDIDGRRVAESGRNLIAPERRRVGMVFQDLALWPHMTVHEHLAFALRFDMQCKVADRSDRIRQILEIVQLADRAQTRPAELSGGEQQRVALGRALVTYPAIVLMDEPLSSLDEELSLHLRREVLRLHAQLGFTLLYVTHSREEAAGLGSRIIGMRQGRLAPSA